MPKTPTTITRFNLKDEEGQSFLEFVLLLLIMFGMSFIILVNVNSSVGKHWVNIITVISEPTDTNIEIRQ